MKPLRTKEIIPFHIGKEKHVLAEFSDITLTGFKSDIIRDVQGDIPLAEDGIF